MDKISPEKYRTILEGIEFDNILLKNSKSHIDHDLISEGMSISIKDDATYKLVNDGFIVEDRYILTSKNKDRKIVLKIECTYQLYFKSHQNISDDFFDVYKNYSLPLNVWPFFREFVNSMTSRMSIPPLVLPLLKR